MTHGEELIRLRHLVVIAGETMENNAVEIERLKAEIDRLNKRISDLEAEHAI